MTGRWIVGDPIGFAAGDATTMRYLANAPRATTDPSGLMWAGWAPWLQSYYNIQMQNNSNGSTVSYSGHNAASFYESLKKAEALSGRGYHFKRILIKWHGDDDLLRDAVQGANWNGQEWLFEIDEGGKMYVMEANGTRNDVTELLRMLTSQHPAFEPAQMSFRACHSLDCAIKTYESITAGGGNVTTSGYKGSSLGIPFSAGVVGGATDVSEDTLEKGRKTGMSGVHPTKMLTHYEEWPE